MVVTSGAGRAKIPRWSPGCVLEEEPLFVVGAYGYAGLAGPIPGLRSKKVSATTEKQLANLRPLNTRPREEHIALSRKGGIASGVARRRRRNLPLKSKAFEKALEKLLRDAF
jgi:hypothetical protein